VQYNLDDEANQIDLDNQTECEIDLEFLQTIATSITKQDIELIICNNDYIHEINLEFRKKDKATDVLSFPYEQIPNMDMPIGSIVISVDFVEEKSQNYKHSFNDELSLLFIHGLLHLVGYDHEVDNGEHRDAEEQVINKFNLPASLIVRTNEE